MATTLQLQPLNFTKGMLTRRWAIDASAAGWGILGGTMQPATSREVRQFRADVAEARQRSPLDAYAVECKFFASHLKTWNVNGEDGKPAPITADTIAMLPVPFWEQLDAVVLGYTAEPALGNSVGSSGS
jgi:hypothetical protein